jgi:hypothetical protein
MPSIRNLPPSLLVLPTLLASALALPGGVAAQPAPVQILINHVGYDARASKKLVIQAPSELTISGFQVVDKQGRVALEGKLGNGGKLAKVDNWKRWRFLRGDFSALDKPGTYQIRVNAGGREVRSEPFQVAARLLPETLLFDLLFFLKSQRSSGVFDLTDRTMTFHGEKRKPVDVRGGWFDASGDVSKYLSHLSYANYMNPQQTPFVVWSLIESAERLAPVKSVRLQALRPRLLEEAVYGADFLVRMQDPAGYFYLTIFDVWSHDPKKREISAYKTQDGIKTSDYKAGYREGGGLAIAALARVAGLYPALGKQLGDYSAARYLAAAEKGFAHLQAKNLEYVDDKQENIIDDYTALLAASELYQVTRKPLYLQAARARRQALVDRLSKDERQKGFWRADAKGERPYFHAVEAGLPVVALLRYRAVEPDASLHGPVLKAVSESLAFELGITAEVFNPFGYARQYVKDLGGGKRSAFFFPHRNESGYWWQGESARQGSLATAALLAGALLPAQKKALETYATDQIDWILGLNPFDVCLLQGRGRNNPEYEADQPNAPGGVANGITGGFDDERDIDFLPEPHAHNPSQRWRWSEQWIPHGAWLTLALAAQAAALPEGPIRAASEPNGSGPS